VPLVPAFGLAAIVIWTVGHARARGAGYSVPG